MVAVVRGSAEVTRALELLRKSVQTRITKAAQRTALAGLAKQIKAAVPGKYKAARAGIGYSLKRGRASGVVEGKAGIAVGIRGKRLKRMMAGAKAKSEKRGRRGVGIGSNNLQWFVMGTKERAHRITGHRTGRMAFDPLVRDFIASAWRANRAVFAKTMQHRMKQLIEAEATKRGARGRRLK